MTACHRYGSAGLSSTCLDSRRPFGKDGNGADDLRMLNCFMQQHAGGRIAVHNLSKAEQEPR